MVKALMMLLLLCPAASPVKYIIDFDNLLTSGFSKVPEYMVTGIIQEVTAFHYDDKMTAAEISHDWMREYIKDNRKEWETFFQRCLNYKPVFKAETENFNKRSNQTEGQYVIQQKYGCEWDDETDEVVGHLQYGNNGEDFIEFDVKTETWTTLDTQAESIKQEWDGDKTRNTIWKNFLMKDCSNVLNMYLRYGRRYVNRKDLPSVSLLQKTPSSPVSCHATGFYPDRAEMFWSKDGEEIHEGVNHGSILPNHDESFQMSIDLEVSSIPSEEWTKYDCVFQLSGVKNIISTKLDKDVIQSNRKPGDNEVNLSEISIIVIAVMAVLIVIVIVSLGFMAHKKKIERSPTPSSETVSL